MKSDIKVKDPAKRPIVPKVPSTDYPQFKFPSRFKRKKLFSGPTESIYNKNFKNMPSDF